jgi:FkbM family methyltransferase
MFESYAQNCEDVVLWRALRHVHEGTYVDVGAADPDDDSVTRAFYERGWSGLNVEPAHEHVERLLAARGRDVVVQACAGEHDGMVVLHHVVGTGLSSVVDDAVGRIEPGSRKIVDEDVPMRRLDEMLSAEGFGGRDIHFLKVDVEGFERQVLLGIDLKVWRPWVVVVEATLPNSTEQVHHEWEPLLIDAGYTFCLFDGLNRFYASPEHPDLIPSLSYPTCFFDHPFVTPPHAALLREYANLLDGDQRLQASYERALVSFEQASTELDRTRRDFETLEAVHQKTVADWTQLEATYLKTVGDWQQLNTRYEELVVSFEEHRAAVISLGSDLAAERGLNAALSAERDTLRDGVARMGAEFDELRTQRDDATRELVLIRQTLSWRVTKPLRAVRRLRAR